MYTNGLSINTAGTPNAAGMGLANTTPAPTPANADYVAQQFGNGGFNFLNDASLVGGQ